jgi:hypothetical protein
MVLRLIVLGLVLFVSGCVFSTMEKGLDTLTGQHIDVAIDALGLPSAEMNVAGRRVIIWSTERNMVLPQTNTSYTSGNVGSTPYYGSTTSTSYAPHHLSCVVKVEVDAEGIIKTWEYEGNLGACETYSSRLKKIIPRTQ